MDVVFFKKTNTLLIIFLISVILSFLIINYTQLYTVFISEEDLDFENDKTGKQRWSTMMKLILVLLLVICLVYSLIMFGYYGYFNTMHDNGNAIFLDKFWYCSNGSNLLIYYVVLFIILVGFI